jgi:hypothetical protein
VVGEVMQVVIVLEIQEEVVVVGIESSPMMVLGIAYA